MCARNPPPLTPSQPQRQPLPLSHTDRRPTPVLHRDNYFQGPSSNYIIGVDLDCEKSEVVLKCIRKLRTGAVAGEVGGTLDLKSVLG